MPVTEFNSIASDLEFFAQQLQDAIHQDGKAWHLWVSTKRTIHRAVGMVCHVLFPLPPPGWKDLRLAFDCFNAPTTAVEFLWRRPILAYLRGKYQARLGDDFGAYEGPTLKVDDQGRYLTGPDGTPATCEEDYGAEDWLKKIRLAAQDVVVAVRLLAKEVRDHSASGNEQSLEPVLGTANRVSTPTPANTIVEQAATSRDRQAPNGQVTILGMLARPEQLTPLPDQPNAAIPGQDKQTAENTTRPPPGQPGLPTEQLQVSSPEEDHSNGLEGGRWLWWQNKRYDVPQGVIYRLLDYMWNKDSVGYDDLYSPDGAVFDEVVVPGTIRARASEANKVLQRVGIPWRLSADSTNRFLTKVQI